MDEIGQGIQMNWSLLAHMLAHIVLLTVLVGCTYNEVKDNRIPNQYTFSGILAGFAIYYLFGSDKDFLASLMGFAIGFGFLGLFFIFKGVKGGDVKLMACVGALVQTPLILYVIFFTAVIGGLMAMIKIIWNEEFWKYIGKTLLLLLSWKHKEEDEDSAEFLKNRTIPYGVAIASGTILALFLGPL